MTRTPICLGVALLVVAATVLAGGTAAAPPERNATTPGVAVTDAIGAQGATLDGEVTVATLRARLAAAETPTTRANVAAAALDDVDRRLAALDARLTELQTARRNGSLDADAYAVRVVPVVAKARTLAAVVERVRLSTADLDPELRRDANVTRERVAALRSRAERIRSTAREGPSDGLGPGFYHRLASVVATYNDRAGTTDLGVVGAHVDGERVNLHVETDDGDEAVVSFRTTGDERVRDLRAGPHPEATLRMRVDESTARQILQSDRPGAATRRAFATGKIRIEGIGPLNTVRWALANLVFDAARLFADLLSWVVP